MLDYPRRTRLTIYATTELIETGKDAKLEKLLRSEDDVAKKERIIKLNVEAFSWNCPQHITPRYTLPQVEEILLSQIEYIASLQ
jgi:hypothetical protein